MTRFYTNTSGALAAALVLLAAASCSALTLISPTEGQAVREKVKIQFATDALSGGSGEPEFISIHVGEGDESQFVVAIGRNAAKESDGRLTFYWNSKAPYHASSSPGKENYFKDGIYPLTVDVHDSAGNKMDSATVTINIKNKIPRGSPAPAVKLVNKLSFGQNYIYRVHTEVDIFETVAGLDLRILGGLGMASDFQIIQSVEDVRPNGHLMMRYRIGDSPYKQVQGAKALLYQDMKFKPQLYRLVDKYGTVIKANLFSKQARFTIMDVLPVLPRTPVKEGDSWPDSVSIKIEGLTGISTFEGSSQLDCFEWEQGRECVKIKSRLTGDLPISFGGGRIRGTGRATADVTTYFAYKVGRLIRREMTIDIAPALIDAISIAQDMQTGMSGFSATQDATGFIDDPQLVFQPESPTVRSASPPHVRLLTSPIPGETRPAYGTSASTAAPAIKKGKIRLSVVVNLEK